MITQHPVHKTAQPPGVLWQDRMCGTTGAVLNRLWGRVAVALGAGLLLAVAAAPMPAEAVDDYLVASDPARHQELKETPGWVTLAFQSKANAKLAKIIVLNSAGTNVTTGPLIVEGTNVTSQLNFNLPKDTYTVLYRTSGSDGRIRGGSFQFAYGKGTWTSEQQESWIGEAEQPTILASSDPTGTATAAPSPSASGTVPSPSGSATATGPAFSEAPAPGSSQGSSGVIGWLIGGGVLLLAAAGVGGWWGWRKARRADRS